MKALIFLFSLFFSLLLVSCSEEKEDDELRFSTCADYPPFEYSSKGNIQGFDIDLARLIAKELGKNAVFDNRSFSAVLPALNSGQDDLAISTITVTEERKKNFDFSITYYFETMAAVFPKNQIINDKKDIKNKKIAVQLGSVLDLWAHQHYPHNEIVAFDTNNQAIEALSAGYVDLVLMDGVQGKAFSAKNNNLASSILGKSNEGYALALKKGSPLTKKINQILQQLKAKGELQKLENQWIDTPS
ncbi:ABC transporter substrate-binding protein [Legionella sp. km772]|uniref:ABC transporter substrate-binding protein n=1 Tax=Legionella sp. km772 TaxID=2498111 RepID=UPI000F8DFC42|nr:ABC transporter substrate-binding protein [Legionella sp. km772]RUR13113.1 amino acid ABC transporter substrate-binding protein [Legionella sp. km772]